MKPKFDVILGMLREEDEGNGGTGFSNIDGGTSTSVYLITQLIDGGTA